MSAWVNSRYRPSCGRSPRQTFWVWYRREHTLSIHSIVTPRREAYYWAAILFTFALGTSAGDLVAEEFSLGYWLSALIFGTMAGFGFALLVSSRASRTLAVMLGSGDAYYYTDGHGHPLPPPVDQIENPDPQPETNNWYTQDGYGGGSYSNCSDAEQPGVGTILGTVFGVFIPAVLQNGFVIVGVQPFWQQVAVGIVLIGAVYLDQLRRARYRQ